MGSQQKPGPVPGWCAVRYQRWSHRDLLSLTNMKSLGLALLCLSQLALGQEKPPNIIFILADDLGWNDVSWHNPDMPTATLARLASDGVRLDQAYSQQVCTPSRAALLTGKYPFHIGRQKRALKPLQPTGLMLNLTTLPQEMKQLGYQTHMVGKWHLGYCASEYTPTRRGFDTFLGFYLGSQNHFSHDRDYKTSPEDPPTFYDFREGEEVARKYEGEYSTIIFKERSEKIIRSVAEARDLNAYGNYKPFFLYLSLQATHAPLQARAEVMAKIPQSSNPARDIYKAMVYDVDMAVDEIVKTLKETNLYSDTLIVFTSDNGGAISHGASNYPLRGTKGTLFEGGTRVPTFLLGPPHLLPSRGQVSNVLLHISDWMPTLLKMAGYEGDPSKDLQLDGVDQSEALLTGQSAREEMVYNLKNNPLSGAYRKGPYKIIFGKKFNKQGWYDTDNTALQCSRMIKDKKSKRREESSNSRPQRRKNKKKNAGSGRKGRVIELLTSKKIDRTLSSGPAGSDKDERGNWRRRKRRREMMMRKKQKKKREKNKSQGKRKGKGNKNKGRSFPKPKRNKMKKNGREKQGNRNKFKIISEIFEDKHFELDFIRKLRSKAAEKKSSRWKKRTERRREKDLSRIEKKFQKIWKDWLPLPGL